MSGSTGLEERGNWSSQGPQKKRRKGGEADVTPPVPGFAEWTREGIGSHSDIYIPTHQMFLAP